MSRNLRTILLLLFLVAGYGRVAAQQFAARNGVVINSKCNGFYEYLPAGYTPAGSQKYPLLIALHGVGERGDGSSNSLTGLPLLINPNKGLASLIYSGGFPSSFTVGGNTLSFI